MMEIKTVGDLVAHLLKHNQSAPVKIADCDTGWLLSVLVVSAIPDEINRVNHNFYGDENFTQGTVLISGSYNP